MTCAVDETALRIRTDRRDMGAEDIAEDFSTGVVTAAR
jgi:hypothetical protein